MQRRLGAVAIENIDNPGWSLRIELVDTSLEAADFSEVLIERSENDWVHCKVEKSVFQGYGGPENLGEILGLFLDWVDSI